MGYDLECEVAFYNPSVSRHICLLLRLRTEKFVAMSTTTSTISTTATDTDTYNRQSSSNAVLGIEAREASVSYGDSFNLNTVRLEQFSRPIQDFDVLDLVENVLYSQVCNAYEKLEFDFGENALKTAIPSKECRRCANSSIGQEPEIV